MMTSRDPDGTAVPAHPPRRVIEAVWLLLVLSTAAAWLLGEERLFGRHPDVAATLILAVSMVKVWLVLRYFMETRGAPAPLRRLLDGYVGAVFTALSAIYLFW